MVKLAINGFGRIGRLVFRQALLDFKNEVEVVAINTSGAMEAEGWATLLQYDSVYRAFSRRVQATEPQGPREIGSLLIEGATFPLLAEREPLKIPWFAYQPMVVLESTGVFRRSQDAQKHLEAGAGKVIISAPPKGEDVPLYLMGINENKYQGEKIVSNGSCTTNCVVPVVKVIKDNFAIEQAVLTTIHAYTADQVLVDGSHPDLRRTRAAAQNIIPTETGAASSVVAIYPELAGKFAGTAIRVPVIAGSYSDLTFKISSSVTVDQINQLFQIAAQKKLAGILAVTTDPLVSSDIIGNPASSIVDLGLTTVVAGSLVQIGAWYDNEWAYARRLIELAIHVGSK